MQVYRITIRRTVEERAVIHIPARTEEQAQRAASWNHQDFQPEWHHWHASDVEVLECNHQPKHPDGTKEN